MSEAAKLIFGLPVMIDGFALNSNDVPVRHFALLDEVAETVNASDGVDLLTVSATQELVAVLLLASPA